MILNQGIHYFFNGIHSKSVLVTVKIKYEHNSVRLFQKSDIIVVEFKSVSDLPQSLEYEVLLQVFIFISLIQLYEDDLVVLVAAYFKRFQHLINIFDFKDDANGITIEYVCEKTIKEGFVGRVSVGHLTSLGALPKDKLNPIIELISKAGINVMSLPATDLHLGGRKDEYNVRRAVTPVRALRDGGVNVCLATNNIRNAFTPYGNGDLMQIAMLAIPVSHLGGADDLPTVLPMITSNPAKALGLKDYGIEAGKNADLVLLDTKIVNNAIIDIPDKLFVIKNGKITVETERKIQVNA